MNWTIYCIECVASVALFTCAIMIPLCRNPVWWIHDYPADIQKKYFENHERIPAKTLSLPVLLKKGFALLLCVAVFVGLALLAGAKDFKKAFLASYGLWLVVDWYDCLCPSENGPVNWGHCGISFGDGRVIHAWDMVRVDDYLAIEKLTALTGDHPKYLGWVALERVLNQKPRV